MRILLITQWFDPEPHFKGMAFARELLRRGHEVEVLTGFPNYPGGKLYQGYRVRLFRRETIEGVRVNRVCLYPSHDQSALRRVLNYASFALSAAMQGPFLVRKADIAYVYHPPATVALAAWSLRLFRGIRFVYDIQDLWPDTLGATGMIRASWPICMAGKWCEWIYRTASKVVVLSHGFKACLISRGVEEGKIEVIRNWADTVSIAKGAADPKYGQWIDAGKRFNVVFAGTMGKAQALDAVIEAAGLLKDRLPEVQFVFVGGGIERDRLAAKASGLPNVRFLPRMPMSEVGGLLAAADVLLVHLKKDPLFSVTIPSKIQAYLGMGRPILAALEGESASIIVAEARAGISCEPESSGALAEAVERLYRLPSEERERMGAAGREYYARELAIEVGVERFEKVFRSVSSQV